MKCDTEYSLSVSADNFFIILNLEYQLRQILNNSEIRNEINNNILKQERSKIYNRISDINDSGRYKNDNYIKSKRNNTDYVLTLNINIDGALLFKSSRHSFWPI